MRQAQPDMNQVLPEVSEARPELGVFQPGLGRADIAFAVNGGGVATELLPETRPDWNRVGSIATATV